MIEFCADEERQRCVLAITDRGAQWRLCAGFLGIATKPMCSGETEGFIFAWEGVLFKVYSKQALRFEPIGPIVGGPQAGVVRHLLRKEPAKPDPPYPGGLEEDPAFETMVYAAQVSQRTGQTHVVYVDWRAVDMLEVFLGEFAATVVDLREQAREAAVKARQDDQIINIFQDEEADE